MSNMILAPKKPDILSLRSNEILTAVIHGARKEEPSTEVQLAAVSALYNSLEFVRDNFEREVRMTNNLYDRDVDIHIGRTELHHASCL
jgi:hypothetical protein